MAMARNHRRSDDDPCVICHESLSNGGKQVLHTPPAPAPAHRCRAQPSPPALPLNPPGSSVPHSLAQPACQGTVCFGAVGVFALRSCRACCVC